MIFGSRLLCDYVQLSRECTSKCSVVAVVVAVSFLAHFDVFKCVYNSADTTKQQQVCMRFGWGKCVNTLFYGKKKVRQVKEMFVMPE